MDKTYIIAEIGNTHEGSLSLAKSFATAAADTGVNCIKFQTHIFSEESIDNAPNPPYFKGESRKEYFNRTSFTKNQWLELKNFCEKDLKIDFLSSPFSLKAIDLLKDIGLKRENITYKKIRKNKIKKVMVMGFPMNTTRYTDDVYCFFHYAIKLQIQLLSQLI